MTKDNTQHKKDKQGKKTKTKKHVFNPHSSKTMHGKNHHEKGAGKKFRKMVEKDASEAAQVNANPKSTSFLALPGEIRNDIYDLAFDDRRVLVRYGKTRSGKMKKGGPKALTHERLPFADHLESSLPKAIPFGLMYSCKKIYAETTTVLYSKTKFSFVSLNGLRVFLDRTSEAAKASIQEVQIAHEQFGNPQWTRDIWTKERYDFRFYLACERAADELKSLKTLSLDYRIRDWPMKLHLDTDWAAPLLLFADKSLVKVKVSLQSGRYSKKEVKDCAKVVERALLSKETKLAQVEAEEKEKAAQLLRKMKQQTRKTVVPKTKVLRIIG